MKPHFFEIFSYGNTLLIVGFLRFNGVHLTWQTFWEYQKTTFSFFLTYVLIVLIIRALGVWIRRGKGRLEFREFFRLPSLFFTWRILLAGSILLYGYIWLKLCLPLVHPHLYDSTLWKVDVMLHFHRNLISPLLALFSHLHLLPLMDWYYGNIYLPSVVFFFIWFATHPKPATRISFSNGYSVLWGLGGWLYLALPTLGPCYFLPKLFYPYARELTVAFATQGMLWANYQKVLQARFLGYIPAPFNPGYGIAAFPSLHVAAHAFLWLFTRQFAPRLSLLFAFMTALTFLGSFLTGWHYIVDGYVGFLLAAFCTFIATQWRKNRKIIK